ncbi:MAG: hypothetical protein ACTHLU_08255 [Novosphingobium sp.]
MLNDVTALSRTRFADLRIELERLENAAHDRIGGPAGHDLRRIADAEATIAHHAPECVEDVLWLGQRLARAVLNGWRAELLAPLAAGIAGFRQ